MQVTKRTIYSVEDFELSFEPIKDTIKIKKTKKGYIIKYLVQDDMPESPREWDNLSKMVCFHRNYDLGDKHNLKSNVFAGWEDLKNHLIKEEGAYLISPLYLYDHSGITIKLGSFYGCGLPQGHARFDSGQVGFIYVTKEDIKKNFLVKKITKKTKEKAKEVLRAEVENYDQYLRGDIYMIVKEEYNKNKKLINMDNVGGYLGYEYSLKALETDI